jgi:hypothetical protein
MRTGPAALAFVGLALAVVAAPASAATTRADWVAQVDPICQSAKKPADRAIGAWFKALNKKGALDRPYKPKEFEREFTGISARLTSRLVAIYSRVTTDIAAVVPAPGDESVVATWLADRNSFAEQARVATRALKHRKFKRANRLYKAVRNTLREANGVGRSLGVHHECAPEGAVAFEFDEQG